MTMDQQQIGDLGELQKKLSQAIRDLADAERAESAARSVSTAARNDVNSIQKKIDEVMSTLRKQAPRNSDWADEFADQRRRAAGAP